MKQIIGLYGTSNVGKSETIKNVYRKLTEKYLDLTFLPDFEQITEEEGDICVIIIINGKIIGIESQGDPNSRIFISLPIFVKFKCDIILCATRTRGATVQEVEKLENTYEVKWVKKNPSDKSETYKTDNDNLAIEILNLFPLD
jgi:hypothetical protein